MLVAACGSSGPKVQVNYGLLANQICGKLTAQVRGGKAPTATRMQAIDTAINGLEHLVPPAGVRKVYTDMVANFRTADELIKSDTAELARLARRLRSHPGDKAASAKYAQIVQPIQHRLHAAAAEAHTLGLGNCETAFATG
jgi:hypothetical protein